MVQLSSWWTVEQEKNGSQWQQREACGVVSYTPIGTASPRKCMLLKLSFRMCMTNHKMSVGNASSDCHAMLKAIEAVWCEGACYRSRDRSGILEAICKLRSEFEKVVLLCLPGHREYAAANTPIRKLRHTLQNQTKLKRLRLCCQSPYILHLGIAGMKFAVNMPKSGSLS